MTMLPTEQKTFLFFYDNGYALKFCHFPFKDKILENKKLDEILVEYDIDLFCTIYDYQPMNYYLYRKIGLWSVFKKCTY